MCSMVTGVASGSQVLFGEMQPADHPVQDVKPLE